MKNVTPNILISRKIQIQNFNGFIEVFFREILTLSAFDFMFKIVSFLTNQVAKKRK